MEKMIRWENAELPQMQAIETERIQILAQIGALMMDLDVAKKNLDALNGRHKAAIQQVLQNRGIGQFESARPVQGGVMLQIPDTINGGD